MNLGEKIDRLYRLREERLRLQRQADEVKKQENVVKDELLELMQIEGITKAAGEIASISIGIDIYPRVVEKQKFYRWAVENNRFDLLQSSVNKAPIKEMVELENELPPGVEVYTDWKVTSLRKK
ncbi:MAG: hypothetical protein GXO75_19035 [Calditrichaeota bacterium]|nr:hypothetical protein [Calditrichota bacterium]